MSSVNACFFLGNLTRDPELKSTPSGTAVAAIGIAVNEVYTKDGQRHESTHYFDLEAWGRTAEIAGEYLKKGNSAHFQCRAKLETWEDKQTGQKRSKVKFVIDRLTLLSNGQRQQEETQGASRQTQQGKYRQPQVARPPQQRQPPPWDDSDIPY